MDLGKPRSALLRSKEITNRSVRIHKKLLGVLNQSFTNIGLELAKNLPKTNHQFTEYFAGSDSPDFNHEADFAFNPVDSGDILPIIENINVKKATGPDNISP